MTAAGTRAVRTNRTDKHTRFLVVILPIIYSPPQFPFRNPDYLSHLSVTIRTEPCPIDIFKRYFGQPHHFVIPAGDIFHSVIVTCVAGDHPVKEREVLRFRELFHIPFADIAHMVVTLEAINPAAVVGVAYVARFVDGVGQQAILVRQNILLGGIFAVAAAAL
jgi:hypothetical protein